MQKMKESKYLTVTTTQHSTQPPSGSFFFCLCVCVCCFYAQEAKQPATEFQHDEKSTYPTPIRWAG